uniref:Expressed protein n=1 Tax=Oryza sativa subsp. japonica TaxID=39947 RepID=Q10L16_ORYSJ|nr:expressed protein [Oryza sativa Japonica Group]
MAESEKAMGSPAATEPVKTPAPPATDGPSGDLMQRQYKEDADATHGTLVGDDTDESRRLFLADVVERLDAVKRLEARIREACAASAAAGCRRSAPLAAWPSGPYPSAQPARERAKRGGREREEGKREVDVAR